jgi:hypothetical protein
VCDVMRRGTERLERVWVLRRKERRKGDGGKWEIIYSLSEKNNCEV